MSIATKNNTFNLNYFFVALIAVLLTWEVHEFAHWAMGTILGYDMVMTMNTAYATSDAKEGHQQVISAAGPVITLIEAILIFLLMRRNNNKLLYSFLFTCLYCRLLATFISIWNLNDEARVSKYLGVGNFTLPLMMSAILFFLVYKISRQYGFGKKFNFINLGLVMLFSSIIILSDQFFHLRLL